MKQPGQLHLHRGGSDDKSGGERDVKKEKEENHICLSWAILLTPYCKTDVLWI